MYETITKIAVVFSPTSLNLVSGIVDGLIMFVNQFNEYLGREQSAEVFNISDYQQAEEIDDELDDQQAEEIDVELDDELIEPQPVSALGALGEALEGRRLKIKYSLLDLLEEQMMAPMPALGGGSAPLDSRVIDDPFDLDLETQSLLGLTRADEVDIDEDSVDSDFDGVPNELDADDDTPQIDTMIAERFMQDLLRNEKRVKSERSNFEVGESHATKLKKKYYGRY